MIPHPDVRARTARTRQLRRALAFARPYRREVAILLVLTLLLAAVNAAEPLALKYVFDHLAGGAAARAIVTGVIALLVCEAIREGATAATNWLTWRTRLGIHYELLEATVERLHVMPLDWFRGQGVGAVLTRLDRGIQGFLDAVSRVLFQFFPAVVYLALAVGLMVKLDWRLAALAVAFAPLPALIAMRAAPEQARRERALLDRWSGIYSRFSEVLAGLVTVRSFSMEETERRRFLRDVSDANAVVIRGVGTDTGFTAAGNVVVALARVAAVALGGALVMQGSVTVGTLIAFLGYVAGMFGPVQGLSGMVPALAKAGVSLDEVFSVLDAEDGLPDAPGARALPSPRGLITFEDVHFTYERGARPALDGLDLTVAPGETVAVVGPSGSGKSTLVSLLLRLHDPQQGVVRVDGHPLPSLQQASLRRSIAVVLQDTLLFNDTIRHNIAYGCLGASAAEIERAAREANAHEFIVRQPHGYDTIVGERGGRLSAGQRQRIAIARAFLKNAPILVLDEATASLDAESEALVAQATRRLMRGRTTLVVAHRLATVVHADRILVMKAGRIVEAGTHRELVDLGGLYASLVEHQTAGVLAAA